MIELRNSKPTYLGKTLDGRDRFAVDSYIGAIQMREDDKDWEDINPRLVEDAEGWHSEGTPYSFRILRSGARTIYPDRTIRNEHLHFPAIPLFAALPKRQEGNQIIATGDKYDVIFRLSHTGVKFMAMLKEPPPFERIVLPVETGRLNVRNLLEAKRGLGIPRPRLIDWQGRTRCLNWTYGGGQLELGFDLTGLTFPIMLLNTTVDKQIDADDRDCHADRTDGTDWAVGTYAFYIGRDWDDHYLVGFKFVGVNIADGATIGANSYLNFHCEGGTSSNDCDVKARAEENVSPSDFSTWEDFDGRTLTSADDNWANLENWTTGSWYGSGSDLYCVQECTQEVIDDTAGQVNDIVYRLDDDGSSTEERRFITGHSHWDDGSIAAKLHIEYEEEAVGIAIPVAMHHYKMMRS